MLDFPKETRYDIFLIYSGIIMAGGVIWLYFYFNLKTLEEFTRTPFFIFLSIIIAVLGLYIFFIGLSEFSNNYIKEKSLIELKRKVEMLELKQRLKKLEE